MAVVVVVALGVVVWGLGVTGLNYAVCARFAELKTADAPQADDQKVL